MIRALLLSCSLATFAACDVGTVPEAPKPDGPGVICEPAAVNPSGHHNDGMGCLNAGCHSPTSLTDGTPGNPANMAMGGTLYETPNGAGLGTATIIIEWGAGMSQKTISATDEGVGNFYLVPEELTGITYPATVKVSLCPDAERPMISKLNSAEDLNCSRGGCHGNGTLKVFWRQ